MASLSPSVIDNVRQLVRDEIRTTVDGLRKEFADLERQLLDEIGIRKLRNDEIWTTAESHRKEMGDLERQLLDVSSTFRAELSNLKQQLQVSDTELEPLIRGAKTLPMRLGPKIRNQGHYATEHSAQTNHSVGIDFGASFGETTSIDLDALEEIDAANDHVASLSPEYAAIVMRACIENEVMPDCWGAATLVIVKDFPDIASGAAVFETYIRIGMVMACWAVNLCLQVLLLVWVYRDVLRPEIINVQLLYKKFHGEAFISGSFDEEAFRSLGNFRHKLCDLAITNHGFTCACTFLWVCRCLNEVRSTYRSMRAADSLPQLPAGIEPKHMAYEIKCRIGALFEEKKVMIICLNASTRFWLRLFIFVPRSMLAFCLLFIGVAFLTATDSYTDLILNSLALAFLYDTDELIFRVFLPQRLATYLQRTKIVSPGDNYHLERGLPYEFLYSLHGRQIDVASVKGSYGRSFVFMTVVIIFLFIWFFTMPIIPGYEWDVSGACFRYLGSTIHLPCQPWAKNCFPK